MTGSVVAWVSPSRALGYRRGTLWTLRPLPSFRAFRTLAPVWTIWPLRPIWTFRPLASLGSFWALGPRRPLQRHSHRLREHRAGWSNRRQTDNEQCGEHSKLRHVFLLAFLDGGACGP
jgi:hypothetical protein